jgi:EpsI family protein
MIAHLSDMKYAQGVDHIIYGWLFFGFVMFMLFWAGNSMREDELREEKVAEQENTVTDKSGLARIAAAAVAATVIVTSGPVLADYFAKVRNADSSRYLTLSLPPGQKSWSGPGQSTGVWKPRIAGADWERGALYTDGRNKVELFAFYFAKQSQDLEMINFKNRVYDDESWSLNWEEGKTVKVARGESLSVVSTSIRSSENRRLVWHWYTIAGRETASRTEAKIYEALALLSGSVEGSYMLVMSTAYQRDSDAAEAVLHQFVADNHEAIERCMKSGQRQSEGCSQPETAQ